MAPLKCPLGGWILVAWRAENEPSPFPWKSKTKSQRSNPKWHLQYLITPTFCAKFQPNRLTTTFGFMKLSQTVTLQCLIYIFTLFTLGSIYSTNASGAEQMPGASVAEDLNSERPWTNPTSGHSETLTRASELLAWDHALSLLSLYVSHEKRAWYISLSDHM